MRTFGCTREIELGTSDLSSGKRRKDRRSRRSLLRLRAPSSFQLTRAIENLNVAESGASDQDDKARDVHGRARLVSLDVDDRETRA